tara:strand:+ start:213 stop:332 length:120 start_codon:yes stop_codon:yes gene_type:complete
MSMGNKLHGMVQYVFVLAPFWELYKIEVLGDFVFFVAEN